MLLVSAIQIQSSLTQLSLKSMSATHGQPCQPCFMADMVRIFGGGKQKKIDSKTRRASMKSRQNDAILEKSSMAHYLVYSRNM